MWAIIKYDKKFIEILKREFKNKIDKDVKFYNPKISIQKFKKNKLIYKEYDLLGDYLFCYHKNFENSKNIINYKYTKGLKYFLDGYKGAQSDIEAFINNCKINEDEKGNLKCNFYELFLEKKYKFLSGPFSEKIFNITLIQKQKIEVAIGNIKTKIKRNKYLFCPV